MRNNNQEYKREDQAIGGRFFPPSAFQRRDVWAGRSEMISYKQDDQQSYGKAYHFGLDSSIALSSACLHVAFSLSEIPQLDCF